MKVVYISVDKIKPYPKNPRINDSAVSAVIESIESFGFQQPIVVDKKMVIIVGHTRFKAALKLGMKQVPVCVASSMTAKQVKAYRIADNRSGEFAKWDFDMLKGELESLDDLFTGFDSDEFNTNDSDDDDNDADGGSFKSFDSELGCDYKCPKCNYEWSGKAF